MKNANCLANLKDSMKLFKKNESGTFVMMFAIFAPVLMLSAAVTVQYTIAAQSKSKIQQAADAALMAAAVEANKAGSLDDIINVKSTLKENIDAFMQANMAGSPNIKYQVSEIKYDPLTKLASLDIKYTYPEFMPLIHNRDQGSSNVDTAIYLSSKKKNPISMYLVLDKSGSMGWDGRMVALKAAIGDLTSQMIKEDPDEKYVRMGAVAYDSSKYWQSISLNWKPQTVNAYTQSLVANGGTNSSEAMKTAFNSLEGNKENRIHSSKNNGNPKKYILFLTDGANNQSSYDRTTLQYCNKAKNEEIEIYSIAFQAPTSAQALLKSCASSERHYFKADNANDLIASFKMIGDATTKALAFSK